MNTMTPPPRVRPSLGRASFSTSSNQRPFQAKLRHYHRSTRVPDAAPVAAAKRDLSPRKFSLWVAVLAGVCVLTLGMLMLK